MIECSKCNTPMKQNENVVWKCSKCEKTFKFTLNKLMELPSLIKADGKPTVKCSSCGNGLTEQEKIYWKCGGCGTVVAETVEKIRRGQNEPTAEDIVSDETLKKSPNLIECPDCGKVVSKSATVCPNCGCPIIKRQNIKRRSKKKHKILIIGSLGVLLIGMLMVGYMLILHPIRIYNQAIDKYESEDYEEAADLLNKITYFDKANELLKEVDEILIYNNAVNLYKMKEWSLAKDLFNSIVGYKDTASYLSMIATEEKYDKVVLLYEQGEYQEVIKLLSTIPKYQHYTEMKNKIDIAQKDEIIILLEQGKYEEAQMILNLNSSNQYTSYLKEEVKYERYLYECIRDFKPSLKNPDSLKIHEVLFYKDWKKPSNLPFCIIKYAGENSFGGVSTGYVLYADAGGNSAKYICKGTCDSLIGMENSTYEEKEVCSQIDLIMLFEEDKVGNIDIDRVNRIIKNNLYKSIKFVK